MATAKLLWDLMPTAGIMPEEFLAIYGETINNVIDKAFQGKTALLDEEEIKLLLKSSNMFGSVTYNHDLLGFCFLTIPKALLEEKRVVWVDKIALIPKAQGQGLGTNLLLEKVGAYIPGSKIGYFGCSTQNPALIDKYSYIGKNTFPTTILYSTPDGLPIWTYLLWEIPQINEKMKRIENKDKNVNSSIGLLQGVYKKNITSTNNFNSLYVTKLIQAGFNPDRGDSIILISQLN